MSLEKTLAGQTVETEKVLDIIYQPQAVFRVRAVTRCTSSLEGHTEAVISVAFSPTGKYEGLAAGGGLGCCPRQEHHAELGSSSSPRYLASGSGDTTVRFWDLSTETPQFTAKGGYGGVPGGQLLLPLPQGPPACTGRQTELCRSRTGWGRGSGREQLSFTNEAEEEGLGGKNMEGSLASSPAVEWLHAGTPVTDGHGSPLMPALALPARSPALGAQHRLVARWQETGLRLQEQPGTHWLRAPSVQGQVPRQPRRGGSVGAQRPSTALF